MARTMAIPPKAERRTTGARCGSAASAIFSSMVETLKSGWTGSTAATAARRAGARMAGFPVVRRTNMKSGSGAWVIGK